MIEINVHIENRDSWMDKDVFAKIKLPTLPRVGDRLYLSESSIGVIESKIKSDLKIASRYAPDWFYYGYSNEGKPNKSDLKKLSLDDANCVKSVCFNEGHDFVEIEIGIFE